MRRCDGAAALGTAFCGFLQNNAWGKERGTNLVDSGAFYGVYETADDRWIARGAFYAELLEVLGFTADAPTVTGVEVQPHGCELGR